MNYYRIILWNNEKQEQVIALTKADNAFDAEDKGMEYAKKWESQGYKYHSVDWFTRKIEQLENGETIWIA